MERRACGREASTADPGPRDAKSEASRERVGVLGPGRVRAKRAPPGPCVGPRRDFVDAYGQAAGRAFGSTRTALHSEQDEPVDGARRTKRRRGRPTSRANAFL